LGTALLIARLVLAAAFAVAAVAKLVDRDGTRRMLTAFGAPEGAWLALPAVELVVAAGLVPAASAQWAGIAAAVLLVVFSAAIVRALLRGERPDCRCFGAVGARPVGGWTLARNGALLLLALFVAADGISVEGLAIAGGAIVAALAVANAAFSWQLLQQNGRLWGRIEELEERLPARGPRPGELAPDFDLPDLRGFEMGLDDVLVRDKPSLIVFTDPQCGACEPLLPDIARLQRDEDAERTVVVISRGAVDENRAKASEHGLDLLLQNDFEVARAYGAAGLPAAVALDAQARFEGRVATGAIEVRQALAGVDDPVAITEWTP
jgi:methylamine dehydrogenase accessory protein MauD